MTVYFIRSEFGRVKIGFTATGTAKRLSELVTGSPELLTIAAEVPDGTYDDEQRLHREFSTQRVTGEWFKPHKELEALISYVKETGTLAGFEEAYADPANFAKLVVAAGRSAADWQRTLRCAQDQCRYADDAIGAAVQLAKERGSDCAPERPIDWSSVWRNWRDQCCDLCVPTTEREFVVQRPADKWVPWDVVADFASPIPYVVPRKGRQRTAQLLVQHADDEQAVAAIWILAALHSLRRDANRIREYFPDMFALERCVSTVAPYAEWHRLCTECVPAFPLPHHCGVVYWRPEVFARLVASARAQTYAAHRIIEWIRESPAAADEPFAVAPEALKAFRLQCGTGDSP